jgi:hypothetical protein
MIDPVKDVVLPASVANATLRAHPRASGRTPDRGIVDFWFDDEGVRSLGTVQATDGSTVDLSTFVDGEVPGVREPHYRNGGWYISEPWWMERDMYEPSTGTESWEQSAYRGKTVHGWDHHEYTFPLADSEVSHLRERGVGAFVKMRLGSGAWVRGWLTTPEHNLRAE